MNTFGISYLPAVIPNSVSPCIAESSTLLRIIVLASAVVDESSPVAAAIPYISNLPSTAAACTPDIPPALIAAAAVATV